MPDRLWRSEREHLLHDHIPGDIAWLLFHKALVPVEMIQIMLGDHSDPTLEAKLCDSAGYPVFH